MANPYSTPATSTDELFKLISRTAIGRTLLSQFMPLVTRKRIAIEDYPGVLRAKLRNYIPEGQPIGACFVRAETGDAGPDRILVDFESARGIAAAFLVHEIVCALAAQTSSKSCRETTETDAIKKQLLFTTELKDRDPEYVSYLRENLNQAVALHQILDFEAA